MKFYAIFVLFFIFNQVNYYAYNAAQFERRPKPAQVSFSATGHVEHEQLGPERI